MYVTPGDPHALARALNELLEDPARQGALGEAGRRIVSERYTPAHHVEALLEAYGRARQNFSQRHSAPASSAGGRPRAAGVRA
jgi:glycosyltransferase involved in cell wall biosynthesis